MDPAKLVVPSDLGFFLYSEMEKRDKTKEFRNLLTDFGRAFPFGTRGEGMFLNFDEDLHHRDGLFCNNSHPIAVQQFSVSASREEAYAEGIYVEPVYRGRGIAKLTREILFQVLLRDGVERFYIGQKGPISGPVRKTEEAQRLAERDIENHPESLIDLKRTRLMHRVFGYGLNLKRYRFDYAPSSLHLV